MKPIHNHLIPFPGFKAINLFGIVFVRSEHRDEFDWADANHEAIHSAQMRELGYFGFYLVYLAEWAAKCLWFRSFYRAYLEVSFEKEAYLYESRPTYLVTRRHFAQWRRGY